jgi:hypothetical protein
MAGQWTTISKKTDSKRKRALLFERVAASAASNPFGAIEAAKV